MKKILYMLPVVLLLAAGCNASQDAAQNTQQPPAQPQSQQSGAQNTPPTKADAVVNSLSQSVTAEEAIGNDATTVTSDQATINGYSEVSNETDF